VAEAKEKRKKEEVETKSKPLLKNTAGRNSVEELKKEAEVAVEQIEEKAEFK